MLQAAACLPAVWAFLCSGVKLPVCGCAMHAAGTEAHVPLPNTQCQAGCSLSGSLKIRLMSKAALSRPALPRCPQSLRPVCHLQLAVQLWAGVRLMQAAHAGCTCCRGERLRQCRLCMLQGSEAQLRRAEAKLDAALNAALGDDPDDFDLADDYDAADSENEMVPALRQGNSNGQGAAAACEDDPASFSRIDLSQPEAWIRAAFPLFPVRPLSPPACLLYHQLWVAA